VPYLFTVSKFKGSALGARVIDVLLTKAATVRWNKVSAVRRACQMILTEAAM
jgi:hypothetical protein